MSDANRQSLEYKAEVTWGTNPGGAGTLLNFTDDTLGATSEYRVSNFIRSDTNRAGNIRTGVNIGGDIGIELQYGGYDEFLEAVLRNTWATTFALTGTTISFTNSDNSVNDSGAGFGDVVEGQWLKVSGTSDNDGYWMVVTKSSSSKLILAGGTVTDETAGASMTVKGTSLINGTTKKSFTIDRQFNDITEFEELNGLRVGSFALNFATADIATGTISFVGGAAATSGSSRGFTGSATAAATTKSMNTINNVKQVFIDRAISTADFTNLSFEINTNSENLRKIGSEYGIDVRQGSIALTGNIGEYFEDNTLLDKSLNAAPVDLAIVTEDDDGNGYIWHFPEVFLESGNPENQGIDTTITVDYGFTGVIDATLGHTVSVTRFAA